MWETRESHGDFTLETKTASFKVHGCVLAAASPVFKAMLDNDMVEKQLRLASIDSEPEDVLALVQFAYLGKMPDLQPSQLPGVLELAHKYSMTDLVPLCCEAMLDTLAVDNAVAFVRVLRLLEGVPIELPAAAVSRIPFSQPERPQIITMADLSVATTAVPLENSDTQSHSVPSPLVEHFPTATPQPGQSTPPVQQVHLAQPFSLFTFVPGHLASSTGTGSPRGTETSVVVESVTGQLQTQPLAGASSLFSAPPEQPQQANIASLFRDPFEQPRPPQQANATGFLREVSTNGPQQPALTPQPMLLNRTIPQMPSGHPVADEVAGADSDQITGNPLFEANPIAHTFVTIARIIAATPQLQMVTLRGL